MTGGAERRVAASAGGGVFGCVRIRVVSKILSDAIGSSSAHSRASGNPGPRTGSPLSRGRAALEIPLVLDLRDALRVRARQIPPPLQDLERVFLIGQPECLGLLEPEQRHVARG